MEELRVEVAENGFVVYEGAGQGMRGKCWAFETADSLAAYMKEWGEEQDRSNIGKVKD